VSFDNLISDIPVGRRLRPTVFYTPEGYSTGSAKLMGRHSAGEAFLRAFLDRFNQRAITFLTPNSGDSNLAKKLARERGHTGEITCVEYERFADLDTSVLYLPTPGISEFAWRRLRSGEANYSICGVTHTTASHRVMEDIAQLLTSPARSWDAMICTSTAVRDSVNEILEPQAEFLRWKLGATRFELPQLPVIPLGVHSKDFQFTPEEREASREKLGIDSDQVVLLFSGRLSFHAKAHPHPMLQGAQLLAEALRDENKQVTLVQCGWYANESIEAAFNEYAALVSPDVNMVIVDGRVAAERSSAWAAADIFVSLSDNIQETFGLTPIEAMAAGLPSVVSDWNGYKDTIEHGVTGFRARTVMPPPGDGVDFAQRYDLGVDSYDMYCGHTCELISVDVAEVASYLITLSKDADLRSRVGQAARERVKNIYEWSQVIKRYEELWTELDLRREFDRSGFGENPLSQPPHKPDPFALYKCYPTEILHDTLDIILYNKVDRAQFTALTASGVHSFAKYVLPTFGEYSKVVQKLLKGKPKQVGTLIHEFGGSSELRARQVVSWLLKVGILGLPKKEGE